MRQHARRFGTARTARLIAGSWKWEVGGRPRIRVVGTCSPACVISGAAAAEGDRCRHLRPAHVGSTNAGPGRAFPRHPLQYARLRPDTRAAGTILAPG